MDIKTDADLTGRGDLTARGVTIPVTISLQHRMFEASPMQCRVRQHQDSARYISTPDPSDGTPTVAELRGETDSGRALWIPRLVLDRLEQNTMPREYRGTVEMFIVGDLQKSENREGSVHCAVTIPPVHFVWTEFDDSGIPQAGSPPPAEAVLRWDTKYGEAVLRRRSDYAFPSAGYWPAKLGLHYATVHIDFDEIQLEFQPPRNVSLGEILHELVEELEGGLTLLSLVNHQRLAWYQARASLLPAQEGIAPRARRPELSAFARRSQWLGYASESGNRWVVYPERFSGIFRQLVDRYEASPSRDLIRQTITFLLASYEEGYFTARLGSLYAALEGLVDRLSQDSGIAYLLDKAPFDRLAKKLRAVIREEVPQQEIAGEIIGKLAELQRRSYIKRLLPLLREAEVPMDKLWPIGANIEEEWQRLLKRRNEFIHQGRVVDENNMDYLFDFERLQWTIELWVLKLLDCPDDALDLSQPGWRTWLNGFAPWRFPGEQLIL
jgi:hypothetical protein